MKAVIQRVQRASVEVGGTVVGHIQRGLVVFLGVAKGDTEQDVSYMTDKIANLRIFEDASGKMNLSLIDEGSAVLVVSQFTLLGDTRRGRRPSFDFAAPPELARTQYESLVRELQKRSLHVETGQFGATMQVLLQNDGPVTFILDSRKGDEGTIHKD